MTEPVHDATHPTCPHGTRHQELCIDEPQRMVEELNAISAGEAEATAMTVQTAGAPAPENSYPIECAGGCGRISLSPTPLEPGRAAMCPECARAILTGLKGR